MNGHVGTLAPFPAWEGNPYLSMLSLSAEGQGWNIERTKTVSELARLAGTLIEGDVVHVHWTSPVTGGAVDEEDAEERRLQFREILAELRDRGVRLIWTVHNEIAHDAEYPETEKALARDLAGLCDVIIQLHPYTAEFVAASYELPPDKLVTLPHSSYLGTYPDGRDDREARRLLGIERGVPTVGFIGQLRQYKGLGSLFRAADLAAERIPDLTLLVAGKLAAAEAHEFREALPKKAKIVLQTEYVKDGDLWKWFRASDVVALPYQKILNSGSILLGATFGRPCIVPDDTPLARLYSDEIWVRSYATEGNADSALADVIVASLADGTEEASAAAEAFARRNTPYRMSRAYAELLRSLDGKAESR